jgi:hypothetical protein
VLCLSTLTNCVELEANADNREALTTATVCTGCAHHQMPTLVSISNSSSSSSSNSGSSSSNAATAACSTVPLLEHMTLFLLSKTKGLATLLSRPPQRHSSSSGQQYDADHDDATDDDVDGSSSTAAGASPGSSAEAECLSKAEADDLVLAGYCCLLLGCMCVKHAGARRTVLLQLPLGSATALSRVLHAFLALQRQAGVLSGEVSEVQSS